MKTGTFTGFETTLTDPGILTIRFNTPERLNGFTSNIKRDLVETLAQAQMENDVRVVVFTGEGRAFCAGDDLGAPVLKNGNNALMPPLHPGHDSPIATYDGLRQTAPWSWRRSSPTGRRWPCAC